MVGTKEERNKPQWQHLLQHRVSVFQKFYHFTLKLSQNIQYKNNLFLRGDHKVPVTQDSFQLFDQISQIS